MSSRKIRVVVAKPGLDGHDRGAKIIARALRDAGMEVIYTGLHQTPEQIVETVLQEDADAVGLSILSGAHMTLVPRIATLLKDEGADDVVLVVGGTIPNDDIDELKKVGVAEVFTPGAPVQGIVDYIRSAVPVWRSAARRPLGRLALRLPRSARPPRAAPRCSSSPNSSAHSRSISAKIRRPVRHASRPLGVSLMIFARRSADPAAARHSRAARARWPPRRPPAWSSPARSASSVRREPCSMSMKPKTQPWPSRTCSKPLSLKPREQPADRGGLHLHEEGRTIGRLGVGIAVLWTSFRSGHLTVVRVLDKVA